MQAVYLLLKTIYISVVWTRQSRIRAVSSQVRKQLEGFPAADAASLLPSGQDLQRCHWICRQGWFSFHCRFGRGNQFQLCSFRWLGVLCYFRSWGKNMWLHRSSASSRSSNRAQLCRLLCSSSARDLIRPRTSSSSLNELDLEPTSWNISRWVKDKKRWMPEHFLSFNGDCLKCKI